MKRVEYSTDEAAFIRLFARPNFKPLGRRLGKRMKHFQRLIAGLGPDALDAFLETGRVELDGEVCEAAATEVLR